MGVFGLRSDSVSTTSLEEMDQKVFCIFLLMVGITHGLQCYWGHSDEDNFDAATAQKDLCPAHYDVCFKTIDEQEGIHRGCGWFQTLKDDTNPVLKRDRCTEAKIAYDGP